jgi:hypothetical protein
MVVSLDLHIPLFRPLATGCKYITSVELTGRAKSVAFLRGLELLLHGFGEQRLRAVRRAPHAELNVLGVVDARDVQTACQVPVRPSAVHELAQTATDPTASATSRLHDGISSPRQTHVRDGNCSRDRERVTRTGLGSDSSAT